jgi:hypothetical protein
MQEPARLSCLQIAERLLLHDLNRHAAQVAALQLSADVRLRVCMCVISACMCVCVCECVRARVCVVGECRRACACVCLLSGCVRACARVRVRARVWAGWGGGGWGGVDPAARVADGYWPSLADTYRHEMIKLGGRMVLGTAQPRPRCLASLGILNISRTLVRDFCVCLYKQHVTTLCSRSLILDLAANGRPRIGSLVQSL